MRLERGNQIGAVEGEALIRRGVYSGNIIIGMGYKREGYSFQRYHLIHTVSVILLCCSQPVVHSIHPSGIAQLGLVVPKESWNS